MIRWTWLSILDEVSETIIWSGSPVMCECEESGDEWMVVLKQCYWNGGICGGVLRICGIQRNAKLEMSTAPTIAKSREPAYSLWKRGGRRESENAKRRNEWKVSKTYHDHRKDELHRWSLCRSAPYADFDLSWKHLQTLTFNYFNILCLPVCLSLSFYVSLFACPIDCPHVRLYSCTIAKERRLR